MHGLRHRSTVDSKQSSLEHRLRPEFEEPPVLLFLEGSCKGLQAELSSRVVTIGRSRDCTIQLDPNRDRLVSGHHVRIEYEYREGAGWWIEDLRSKNGTWRNRNRLGCRARIVPDDEFTLGSPDRDGSVRFHVVFRNPRNVAPDADPGFGVRFVRWCGRTFGRCRDFVGQRSQRWLARRLARSR